MSQVLSAAFEQTELGKEPESAVLLASVRIWRDAGNDAGTGDCRLLLSRWSSMRDAKDEMVSGMDVDRPAEVIELNGA